MLPVIKIVSARLSSEEIGAFLGHPFPDMIKFVADTRRGMLALGGELHADAEAILLEDGSQQADLWGGNFFPRKPKHQQVDFTSLINIRPSAGNPSMDIRDAAVRAKMLALVEQLLG